MILRQYSIDARQDRDADRRRSRQAQRRRTRSMSSSSTPTNVAAAIRDSNLDVIMSVGPVGSPITAAAIAAATRGKEPPTFLAIGAAEAIAERYPIYESTEIKAGAFGGSPPRPEERRRHHRGQPLHRRAQDAQRADRSPTSPSTCSRSGKASQPRLPAAAKIEKPDTDKDAAVPVHPGAAAYLDGDLKTLLRPLQRPAVLGADGVFVLRLGLRRAVELQQGRRPRPPAARARTAA